MTSGQDVLKDTLTNQLLTFPPRQEMLWREAGVVFTWVGSRIISRLSCPTWLFFLSRITVPSSISNSPWSFKHLTCGVRWRHPVIRGKLWRGRQVCEGTWSRAEARTDLNIETLRRLRVLRDVQAVTSTHGTHEVGQRLFILVEPLQLARAQTQTESSRESSVMLFRLKYYTGMIRNNWIMFVNAVMPPPLHTCGSGRWQAARCHTPSAAPWSSAGGRIWWSRSNDGWTVMRTGETRVSWFLQVCDHAALVPQQAAVAQFDGGNELCSTGLRLVTGWKENTTHARLVSRHFCICHVDRRPRHIPREYGGPLWKWTESRTKLKPPPIIN